MTDVLILGGTGWLSGRIAQRWLLSGATVTCVARGGRPAPEGATLVLGDRDDAAVFDIVGARDWDHVIDVSSRADHVRAAVAALGPRAGRWTYISSMSVYADDETPDADETAPLLAAAQPGDEYDYGAEKVAAEEAVGTLGDRALIVRPGLIVGDGDPSDRFGYWAAAFLRDGDGTVLVPEAGDRPTQVIDVDDLADFVVATSATGAVNAIGDRNPLGPIIERVRAAAAHRGDTRAAGDEWLRAHDVEYWMGDRSLPLWLPAEMTGFMSRSNARYRAGGGEFRDLDETIARVVADENERDVDRPRRAGLTRDDELELLGLLD